MVSLIGGCGPAVLAVLWTLSGIALFLIILRSYAASVKSGRLRWDYIWMLLSFLVAIGAGTTITIGVINGLGNHLRDFKEAGQIWDSFYYFYWTVYLGTISIGFSKFSVIALLLDVHRGSQMRKRRWALWGIGALFGITSLLEIFLVAFQCRPLSKTWNLAEPGVCPAARAAKNMPYVHGAIGGITDIMLALWPISIVWNLQTSRKVKVGFCALMAVGIVPGIASFIRVWLLQKLHTTSDPTYESGLFLLAATVEAALLIILGSIPPLRPLFMRVFYGIRLGSSNHTSHGATNPTAATALSHVGHGGHKSNHAVSAIDADYDMDDISERGLVADDAIVVHQTYEIKSDGRTESFTAKPSKF